MTPWSQSHCRWSRSRGLPSPHRCAAQALPAKRREARVRELEPLVISSLAEVQRAARLVAVDPLRVDDALPLASALAVRDAGTEVMSFVCFDRTLAAVALAEGLSVIG